MQKIFFLLFLFTISVSCKKEQPVIIQEEKLEIPAVTPELAENAVIYEANIRQYSPEGTFNAFAKDIPKLKKLGIKILWLMPVHEIGIKKRKAKINVSIEENTDSIEKKKYLGNPYSVKDYRSINPDFGNKADFEKLVKAAHKNGIYVILDWVGNHTAWDHAWITQRPEYYTHDKEGNIVSPYDWTDVAKLDYKNQGLRLAMLEEMKYWLKEFNIDGFRCELAAEVPVDFWEKTKIELNKIKPVFMLMEAEKTSLMTNAFDMQYAWKMHYIMNGIAKEEKTIASFDSQMVLNDSLCEKDDIYMNFISNHGENFWNGTEYERMGESVGVFTALTYLIPGMPLIYSGQEYDLKERLKFFEKDTIPHTVGKMMTIYEKLGKLKSENPALNGGKNPASYHRILTSDDLKILAFEREKSGNKIIFLSNLTKTNTVFTAPIEGIFTDYMSGQKITFAKDQKLNLKPWEYKILIAE
ncbi:alpha-amylase family glycosyl hydrolase [Flavobacterium sp.]|uniref:alpha-amylase family glycosyl hydrolase n=1 Tax=Flavobacterium sp. TaxID=239 RepID=UPI00374DB1EA